jgi:hypothetical protein
MLPVVLLGIGAFAAALVVAFGRHPATRVLAQDACAQPSSSGCPIELDAIAQAAITDPAATHNWLLNVPGTNDIVVALGNLGGDYQLWVYGPDNSLLGISNNPGNANEEVRATNVGTGTYWIVVDSPSGQASELPYTLFATNAAPQAAPAPAPTFSSYSAPAPRTFLPY